MVEPGLPARPGLTQLAPWLRNGWAPLYCAVAGIDWQGRGTVGLPKCLPKEHVMTGCYLETCLAAGFLK